MTSETTLTPTDALTERLARTKSAVAVTVLFAVNGMILGGYGGTLPSIRDRVDIDATHIALMLFCGSLAGILSMQVGGRLADAIGVQVESARRRPIMSFFHAFWSVGSFVGAGSVLIVATLVGLTGGHIVA